MAAPGNYFETIKKPGNELCRNHGQAELQKIRNGSPYDFAPFRKDALFSLK